MRGIVYVKVGGCQFFALHVELGLSCPSPILWFFLGCAKCGECMRFGEVWGCVFLSVQSFFICIGVSFSLSVRGFCAWLEAVGGVFVPGWFGSAVRRQCWVVDRLNLSGGSFFLGACLPALDLV